MRIYRQPIFCAFLLPALLGARQVQPTAAAAQSPVQGAQPTQVAQATAPATAPAQPAPAKPADAPRPVQPGDPGIVTGTRIFGVLPNYKTVEKMTVAERLTRLHD